MALTVADVRTAIIQGAGHAGTPIPPVVTLIVTQADFTRSKTAALIDANGDGTLVVSGVTVTVHMTALSWYALGIAVSIPGV